MNANNKNYSIRPLTEEEKIFAADEGNYSYLFFYMRKMRLDPEEWYDILIIPYLDAVKKYHEYESARQYTFSTVLKNKLYSALTAELKKRKSQKRMPEGGFVSLDYTMEGDNPFSEHPVEVYWIDPTKNVEAYVIEKEFFRDMFDNASHYAEPELLKMIIKMRINGYTNTEIARKAKSELGDYNDWTLAEIKELIRLLTLGRNRRCALGLLLDDTKRFGNYDEYCKWENMHDM